MVYSRGTLGSGYILAYPPRSGGDKVSLSQAGQPWLSQWIIQVLVIGGLGIIYPPNEGKDYIWFLAANWVIIYHQSHPLQEPEELVDYRSQSPHGHKVFQKFGKAVKSVKTDKSHVLLAF